MALLYPRYATFRNTECLLGLIHKIIISGVVSGHVAFKTIYIRIFAGTNRIQKKDFVAVGSWVGIALILWVVAWVIASAIPVFNNLLSLIVCSLFSYRSGVLARVFYDDILTSNLTERPIRQLVHLRLPGHVLAIHEQESMVLFAQ